MFDEEMGNSLVGRATADIDDAFHQKCLLTRADSEQNGQKSRMILVKLVQAGLRKGAEQGVGGGSNGIKRAVEGEYGHSEEYAGEEEFEHLALAVRQHIEAG